MRRLELHVHSTWSDGTLAPAEVIARAAKARVELLFLTDHDTVSGYAEARAAGVRAGIPVHCGIEINTCSRDQVHVLGYGIDPANPVLAKRLEEFRGRRETRVRRIVENLQNHGVDIRFEDIGGVSRETLGRPHVADALIGKKIVRSRGEAFERFLSRGRPGYVEPMGPSAVEAIATIRAAGGFSSLAHPETVSTLEADLAGWIAQGLEGLEVYYAAHRASTIARYAELAQRHGLLSTGGSDFHGPGTGRDQPLGVEVPDAVRDRFMERIA